MKKLLRLHANNEEQEVFIFSLNGKNNIEKLQWEGDDEFYLNGEMYDVIESKIINGKLVIRCISDKKETALIKNYEKITKENNSKSKSALLLKLVSSCYLATEDKEPILKYTPVPSNIYFASEFLSSQVLDVLTPPPQAA
jgi:hypothetical protein